MQDNEQENYSIQRVEYAGEAFDGNLEQVLKNDEEEQRAFLNHEEKLGLTEKKQSFISVQESTTRFPVAAEIRNDTVQVSNGNFQRKSHVWVKAVKWRPKTRVKNKL